MRSGWMLCGLVLLVLCCVDGCTRDRPDQDLCLPKSGGFSDHPDWLSFQASVTKGAANACLQMAWFEGAQTTFKGSSATLAHLDQTGQVITRAGVGNSPFVGLMLPAERGPFAYRFRLFLFYGVKASEQADLCDGAMKADGYDCLSDPRCRFFLEFRPSSSAFQGETLAIEDDGTLSCRTYLRKDAISNDEPDAGEDIPEPGAEPPERPDRVDGGESGPEPDNAVEITPDVSCQVGQQRDCYDGPPGTSKVAPCSVGKQRCQSDHTWSACTGQVLPGIEICNGKDDDCDGLIDEASECAWLRNGGENGDDLSHAVVPDPAGGAYIAGSLGAGQRAVFGALPTPSINSVRAGFVASIDKAGDWKWLITFGGSGAEVTPLALARDPKDGSLYVGGYFKGDITFIGRNRYKCGTDQHCGFIAKYKPNGSFLWVMQLDSKRDSVVSALLVGQDGTLIVGGTTYKETFFPPFGVISLHERNGFVAQLSSDGKAWRWAQLLPQAMLWEMPGPLRLPRLAWTPKGNVAIVTYYTGKIRVGDLEPPEAKGQAAVVAAIDPKQQKWLWFASTATTSGINGTTQIYPMAIDVNASGEIVIGGTIAAAPGDVSFGAHKISLGGTVKAFVAKLTPGGSWLDALAIGGVNQRIYISGLGYDAKDNLLITGGLSDEATFGTATIKSVSWLSHFVASRSTTGQWLWATSGQGFPTAVDDSKINYRTDIAVLPSGDYFVVGGLVGNAFGGQTLAPAGTGSNAFIGYNPHIQGE